MEQTALSLLLRGKLLEYKKGYIPSSGHIDSICKAWGARESCRYLVDDSQGGKACARFGQMHRAQDAKANAGRIEEKGKNCLGVLRLILEHKEELLGCHTLYMQSGLSNDIRDELVDLTVGTGSLVIKGRAVSHDILLDQLQVVITDASISFGSSALTQGQGNGTTIVYFAQ